MHFFEESCYSLSEMFGDVSSSSFWYVCSEIVDYPNHAFGYPRLMHEDIPWLGKPENNVRKWFLGLEKDWLRKKNGCWIIMIFKQVVRYAESLH